VTRKWKRRLLWTILTFGLGFILGLWAMYPRPTVVVERKCDDWEIEDLNDDLNGE